MLHGEPATAFAPVADRARFYEWPTDQRPHGARLHVAVADDDRALVTGANFTNAIERNLEVGVLIRAAPSRAACASTSPA